MTRLRTPVCLLLGINVPVVQGGMATYTSAELVAAVSNAGGLGIIGALRRSVDELRDEIQQVRRLTSRPFGVNHVVCLADSDAIELTLAERVPVLSLSWGRATDLTRRAHEAGIKVLHQVNTPEEAGQVAADGADVIVAQGTEGGGHVGVMSTLPLVPQVVDAVDGVPVLAAGGIADGRGLAAAIMLNTIAPEASAFHADRLKERGQDFGEDVRVRIETGFFFPVHWYLKAQRMRSRLVESIEAAFGDADMLICPTMRATAPQVGASRVDIEGKSFALHTSVTNLTVPFNLSGLPAASIPWSASKDGAPISLQIVGRRGHDWRVLAFARRLELASPWHARQPR